MTLFSSAAFSNKAKSHIVNRSMRRCVLLKILRIAQPVLMIICTKALYLLCNLGQHLVIDNMSNQARGPSGSDNVAMQTMWDLTSAEVCGSGCNLARECAKIKSSTERQAIRRTKRRPDYREFMERRVR